VALQAGDHRRRHEGRGRDHRRRTKAAAPRRQPRRNTGARRDAPELLQPDEFETRAQPGRVQPLGVSDPAIPNVVRQPAGDVHLAQGTGGFVVANRTMCWRSAENARIRPVLPHRLFPPQRTWASCQHLKVKVDRAGATLPPVAPTATFAAGPAGRPARSRRISRPRGGPRGG